MRPLLHRLRFVVLASGLGLTLPLQAAFAAQWADVATISSTLGSNNGRVCVGGGGTDLGCPVYAPTVLPNGYLGVNMPNPSATLHVNGNGIITGALDIQRPVISMGSFSAASNASIQLVNGSGGNSGNWQIVVPFGGGSTAGRNYDFIIRQANSGIDAINIDDVTAYTGIRTANPSTTLHVSGTLRIANGGEACDANRLGAIRYQNGAFAICQNVANGWEPLATLGETSVIDRITSSSQAGVTANATGYISLTTGGVTGTVYFTPSGRLVNGGVSTTGPISGTDGYFNTLRLGQTGAFTSSISPFLSYGDIVGNYTGIAGMEMRNTNGGVNSEFRFMVSDERGAGGTQLAFSMPSSNNTVNLFGMPRNQLASIFVNGTTDANARALALGTLKAQPLILGVNNAEAMRIVSTGLVGIGTSTPTALLTIKQANTSSGLRLEEYSGSSNVIMYMDSAGRFNLERAGSKMQMSSGSNGFFGLIVNSVSAVNVASDGSTWLKNLLVSNNSARAGVLASSTLHVDGALIVGRESSTTLQVCDANRVGGIKYEGGALQICQNPAYGWENIATTGDNSLADRITSGTTQVIAKQNTSVTIATAGVERMVVGTNGNVGVGQQPIANAMVAVSGTVSATMLTVGAQPGAACGTGAYGTIKFEAGRMYVCRQ